MYSPTRGGVRHFPRALVVFGLVGALTITVMGQTRPQLGPGESNWPVPPGKPFPVPGGMKGSGSSGWTPGGGGSLLALSTSDLNSGLTPPGLVAALLGAGVSASNITFTGSNIAAGTFAGGSGIIGFSSGIVLSSGNIASVVGPNTLDSATTNLGLGGDADLNGLIPGFSTNDATVLEFDFECAEAQVVQFQYVFASEEYNEFVNSNFNDVFGFFLNGANIALIPGAGTAVAINNLNCDNPYNPPNGDNCNLFINNDCSDIPPGTHPCAGNRNTEMDGLTLVFTATGTINPGVNHIKLAIADAGDTALDSNVFIKAESFVCQPPTGACCDFVTGQCRDGVSADDCEATNEVWYVGLRCQDLPPPCGGAVAGRVTADQKGSLLLFPKVELRWDAGGTLIQDTFIDLTNDYPDDVLVQMYFVNGDLYLPFDEITGEREHPGCNWIDNQITLTGDEPTYWSAANGLPKGVSPFTVLDPGDPPGRPDPEGSTERVLRGYVLAWAVNTDHYPIRWNHLKGDVLIVNYPASAAWEYNAWAFQANQAAHGQPTAGGGTLTLDGFTYDYGFDKLLLDFYATGSQALSGGGTIVTADTDLTLVPISHDLRQDGQGPICTKTKFDVWNMNEVKFSGAEYCICCWDQRLLGGAHPHFLLNNLQTNKGKARIDGVGSTICPDSQDAALLGVAAKYLDFNPGGLTLAGTNLVGMGEQTGTIEYDLGSGPDEAHEPGQPKGTRTGNSPRAPQPR